MDRRGPSNSSPYGLACTNCFRSKCKCIARPDGNGCQRCHRLKKQCRPSESIRRTIIDEKKTSTSRIDALEQKVENLISQLQTRNLIDSDTSDPRRTHDTSSQRDETRPFQPSSIAGNDPRSGRRTILEVDGTIHDADDVVFSELSRVSNPEVDTGQTLLETFQSRLLVHFAFMHLPVHMTAEKLRRNRPILFQAIACVIPPLSSDKLEQSKELRDLIHKVMMGDGGQRNTDKMDLLLAILTYVAWGWDHVLNRRSVTRLMMLAMSLVGEMRPDKPVSKDATMNELFTPGSQYTTEEKGPLTTMAFLEWHRAVLGCFVLSCAVSAYFGEMDGLRWTPQMEDGLAAISAPNECPTDPIFALQVRLHLFSQRVVYIQQQEEIERGQAASRMSPPSTLISLASLEGQFQELKASLSPSISQRSQIMLCIYSADMIISDAMRAVNSMVPVVVNHLDRMINREAINEATGRATNDLPLPYKERFRCLLQCAESIGPFINALLSLPLLEFVGISFLQWAQLARCIAILNRLIPTIGDTAWDRTALRSLANVPALLGRLAERFDWASQLVGESGLDDVFTNLACKLRQFLSKVTNRAEGGDTVMAGGELSWSRLGDYGGTRADSPETMMPLVSIMDAAHRPIRMA